MNLTWYLVIGELPSHGATQETFMSEPVSLTTGASGTSGESLAGVLMVKDNELALEPTAFTA